MFCICPAHNTGDLTHSSSSSISNATSHSWRWWYGSWVCYSCYTSQQDLSSCWDGYPFGHNRHGRKSDGGAAVPLSIGGWGSGGWVPINTMWPGPRPTSIPSGISIHLAIWPQQPWAENWGDCAPFLRGWVPILIYPTVCFHCIRQWLDLWSNTVHLYGLHTATKMKFCWKRFNTILLEWFQVLVKWIITEDSVDLTVVIRRTRK